MTLTTLIEEIKEKLLERCEVDPVTECWNWQLSCIHGYGTIRLFKKRSLAHRISYAALARKYNVSTSTIWRVIYNVRYTGQHV